MTGDAAEIGQTIAALADAGKIANILKKYGAPCVYWNEGGWVELDGFTVWFNNDGTVDGEKTGL